LNAQNILNILKWFKHKFVSKFSVPLPSMELILSVYTLLSLWLYSPLLGVGRFFSFWIFYTVGRTLWTRNQLQNNKHRINAHTRDFHVSSGIRTHDSCVREREDNS
jgi:hypothetical protein